VRATLALDAARGAAQPVLLRRQHIDELSAANDQGGQFLGAGFRQGPDGGSHRFGKLRQALRVKGIRLRQPSGGVGKVPHLARVDDDDRHPGGGQSPAQ
jgi:hypothetical protein